MAREHKDVEMPKMILTGVSCDNCGKNMVGDNTYQGEAMAWQGASFDLKFGYGSRYDGEAWTFDLCDQCCFRFRWLFSRSQVAT